jgi:K+ transporter
MRADVEPDDAVERTPHLRRISARIVIAALGVVFGDLGTSPLYTFAAIAEATAASSIGRPRSAACRSSSGR